MTAALESVQLFLLAGLLFAAVGAVSGAVVVGVVRDGLARWEPRARHRALALLAALPALLASALMLSATLPGFLALALPGLDHCAVHEDRHAHLCFVHLPRVSLGAFFGVALMGVASLALSRAALAWWRVHRALGVLEQLAASGEHCADLGATIVETSRPLCLAAGLLRPRILLSRGLLGSLTDEEREIVLAHERAHVRRRDALVAGSARALATLHLPPVARWIARELDIAAEQACDEEAGRAVGDRVAVASAILAVERAAQHDPAPRLSAIAVAFGQRAVARRVESLLVEPGVPRSLRPTIIGLGVLLIGVVAAASELHHLTESLLSFVTH